MIYPLYRTIAQTIEIVKYLNENKANELLGETVRFHTRLPRYTNLFDLSHLYGYIKIISVKSYPTFV